MKPVNKTFVYLLVIQGAYFLLTGLWPLLYITSFMAVTGPKTDVWLVKTLGIVLACEGIAFIISARQNNAQHGMITLAVLNAMVLTAIDVYYSSIQIISKVYLADAAVQVLFICSWVLVLILKNKHTHA